METRVIKVGSSLGLIIPKFVSTEIGFKVGTPLIISLKNDQIVITKKNPVRSGWAESFANYANEGEDEILFPDYLDSEVDELI